MTDILIVTCFLILMFYLHGNFCDISKEIEEVKKDIEKLNQK